MVKPKVQVCNVCGSPMHKVHSQVFSGYYCEFCGAHRGKFNPESKLIDRIYDRAWKKSS